VRAKRVFRAASPEMIPLSAESRIEPGSPAHLIREAVRAMDLAPLEALYADRGGVPYEARGMLAAWLLGYALGVTSERGLQASLRYDLRFAYVSGGLTPDDRTLGRFRRRLAPLLEGLFAQVLGLCRRAGLVSARRVAIDGTKLASAASQNLRALRESRERAQEAELPVPPSSDPSARVMKLRGRPLLGYNAQLGVDVETEVVLACRVTTDANDVEQAGPMLELAERNAGRRPEEVLADSGYDSHAAHARCREAGVLAHIPVSDAQEALFWTAVSEEEVVCPMGRAPTGAWKTTIRGKEMVRLFVQGCSDCALVAECLAGVRMRSLTVPAGVSPVARTMAAHRARSPEGKLARWQRMASVEPAFGQIKHNGGFRRFALRGLDGANLEFGLLCMAVNLRKLARTWKRGPRRPGSAPLRREARVRTLAGRLGVPAGHRARPRHRPNAPRLGPHESSSHNSMTHPR
jgi:transposase